MDETNATLIDVSFACQRCCQPLKMHNTLSTINEQIVNELSARNAANTNITAINTNEEIESKSGHNSNVIYKVVPPFGANRDVASNGGGFIVISDSTTSSMSSIALCNSGEKYVSSTSTQHKMSQQMKKFSELFDVLSDQSDIDHPLCEECADFVIDQMDHQLSILEDECRDYREYLDSIEQEKCGEEANEDKQCQQIEDLKRKLENLQVIEKQLIEELNEIHGENEKVDHEIVKQSDELQRLYDEEDKYWHEYNNLKNNVYLIDDEQQSIDNQLRYAQNHLDKLKRTNVFNATFHIWSHFLNTIFTVFPGFALHVILSKFLLMGVILSR